MNRIHGEGEAPKEILVPDYDHPVTYEDLAAVVTGKHLWNGKYPTHDPALPVVAVDFDGVLAENVWPSPHIGALNHDAVDLVCHYARLGCEVVIFTSRPKSHFTRIWAWVKDNGLSSLIYDVTNVKPRACLYFDDRAVRWPL